MMKHCLLLLGFFLVVWGGITLTINSANAFNFRLQNATIAALSERGTFTLKELEVPDFRLIVGQETFRIGEDIYPMKQPGQTILGSLIYTQLRKFGINYSDHYMYASQLVTMFSSALLMAVASVLIGMITWHTSKKITISLLTGFILVFGTIIWPYSGVTHHDIYGTFLVIVAFGGYWLGNVQNKYRSILLFLGGMSAGLSLFFTMLTLPIPFVMLVLSKYKKAAGFGTTIGLMPTFLFNMIVFGKPWLSANLAGKVADTVPLLSITNMLEKLWFYLGNPTTALWAYSPILIFGVAGIWMMKGKDLWLKRFLLLPIVTQIIYVSSIETFGGYQYGPRYLLPIIPLIVLGIPYWLQSEHRIISRLFFFFIVIISCCIAGIGAIQTVMSPIGEGYEPYKMLLNILTGELPVMRVWKYGVAWSILGLLALMIGRRQQILKMVKIVK